MKLVEWMKKNRWQTQEMAKELGVTKGYLSQVRLARKLPSPLFARAIVMFTNGEVTLSDLGIEKK